MTLEKTKLNKCVRSDKCESCWFAAVCNEGIASEYIDIKADEQANFESEE